MGFGSDYFIFFASFHFKVGSALFIPLRQDNVSWVVWSIFCCNWECIQDENDIIKKLLTMDTVPSKSHIKTLAVQDVLRSISSLYKAFGQESLTNFSQLSDP